MIRTRLFEVSPEDPYLTDSTILVRCVDGDAAARGLWAARRRLRYATAEGEEITSEEFRHGNGCDRITPNWISPVWRSELGPTLVLDVNSYASREMARLMRRIIVEELERVGVTDAEVTGFPPGWDTSEEEWTVAGHSTDDDLIW